jgi:hypothetical protein
MEIDLRISQFETVKDYAHFKFALLRFIPRIQSRPVVQIPRPIVRSNKTSSNDRNWRTIDDGENQCRPTPGLRRNSRRAFSVKVNEHRSNRNPEQSHKQIGGFCSDVPRRALKTPDLKCPDFENNSRDWKTKNWFPVQFGLFCSIFNDRVDISPTL